MNASFEPKRQEQGRNTPRNESQSATAYPSRTIVHAKLEMTEPGDHDEQEADAVANTIMSGAKIARKISSGSGGSAGIAVSSQMESQLNHLQGGGQAMPEGLRSMMESGFGQDFGQVRLHTDSEAASLSSSIHAKAFTHGNDIYFNQGQFSPETSEGQKLMAHELTHVVQGGEKIGRKLYNNLVSEIPTSSSNANDTRTWLSTNVLDEEAIKILFEDRENIEQRTPINIVIYTTRSAACNGEDYIYDPECSEPFEGQELNNFIKNTRKKTDYRTYVLYGNDSIMDYCTEMKDLVDQYGPLQNLVIAGHGNWYGPNIGTKDSFSFFNNPNIQDVMDFFNIVQDLMFNSQDANKETMHSIVFDECLVGVGLGDHNYADKVYEIVSESGKFPVRVFANYASTSRSEFTNTGQKTNAEISYDDKYELTYINHTDPTAVCVSDASSKCSTTNMKYKGNDFRGYLAELWRQCNNIDNHIDIPNTGTTFDDDYVLQFGFGEFKSKFQRRGSNLTERMFVFFVNEKIEIINSPDRSEKTRTRTRRKLKELVNRMYFLYSDSLDPQSDSATINALKTLNIDEVFANMTTYTYRNLL